MKPVLPSLALSGIACLWLGCAGAGRPTTVPLRCEARPYSSTSGLVKVEIREPAVVIPSPVQSVKPVPMECTRLAELLEPDEACADPAGPVCAFVVHPTSGRGDSALPDGRFPVVLFSHGNNAPVQLYEGLLKRLAYEGFIVVAPCCRARARLSVRTISTFCALENAGVVVGETPALVHVKHPRKDQRTGDSRNSIHPGGRGGAQKTCEKSHAHTSHDIVDDRDHACRGAEKRERGAKPQ